MTQLAIPLIITDESYPIDYLVDDRNTSIIWLKASFIKSLKDKMDVVYKLCPLIVSKSFGSIKRVNVRFFDNGPAWLEIIYAGSLEIEEISEIVKQSLYDLKTRPASETTE